jgi:methionyl-tRNA formyltransferase
MSRSDLSIVFMGTPSFSVGILDAIIQAGYTVAGVVTVADKPAGRGQQISKSAVKDYAETHNLSIAQPEKLREEAFLNTLRAWNADVFVVVAFRMLPDVVWKMPRLGTFNLHASLLPDYRGAAPINWAVMNGDLETGVSTFFIDEKIDTGNVILQRTMSIGANETAGELHDRMIVTGSGLVVETLDLIQSGKVNPVAQSKFTNVQQRAAPKLFKENTRIDWKRGAKAIHDHIRGLSPYPSAWTLLKNSKGQEKQFKFFRSEIIEGLSSPEIKLWSDKEFIYISYPESTLKILSLQMEGKKQMSSKEWLAGNSISDWHLIL